MKMMKFNSLIRIMLCLLVLFVYAGCKKKKEEVPVDNSCQQVVQGDFELVE